MRLSMRVDRYRCIHKKTIKSHVVRLIKLLIDRYVLKSLLNNIWSIDVNVKKKSLHYFE